MWGGLRLRAAAYLWVIYEEISAALQKDQALQACWGLWGLDGSAKEISSTADPGPSGPSSFAETQSPMLFRSCT